MASALSVQRPSSLDPIWTASPESTKEPQTIQITPPQVDRVASVERPYTVYTQRQKVLIVLASTLGGTFNPFTATIYLPAIEIISQALNTSVSRVNLTITTYMIFQGFVPSVIAAIADDFGRRPAYVIGFVAYVSANLGLALNNSYAGLIVLRCLQSTGCSGLTTLNQGTIADITTSAERGKYISIASIASVFAPSVAPIMGGALAQHLGWHSIFWALLIMSAVYFIPLLLFFPETGRKIVGDGSIPPPKWNRCLTDVLRARKQNLHVEQRRNLAKANVVPFQKPKKKVDLLASLTVIADPETAMLLTVIGILYAAFYAINSSLTVQFGRIYNLSATSQGLLFLPQTVGSAAAAVFNTYMVDRRYRYHAQRVGLPVDKSKQINILTSKMPIEHARLDVAIPFLVCTSVFIIIYGWLLEARVHIAGPLVMLAMNAFTAFAGFSCASVLVIDLHRSRSATASAANNLIRCLLGAAATAVVNPMIGAMGNGWCFTAWGLLCLATLPLSLYCALRGRTLREKRWARELAKQEW